MTEKEFMDFFKTYLNEEIIPTMIGKGLGQYSTHDDRFHNFKNLSGLEMETKEKCLVNLVAKQIVCLYDQIREWEKQKGFPATPNFFVIVNEVIKDIIIYMFLLRGMFYEYEHVSEKVPVDNSVFAYDNQWPTTLSGGSDFGSVCHGPDLSKQDRPDLSK